MSWSTLHTLSLAFFGLALLSSFVGLFFSGKKPSLLVIAAACGGIVVEATQLVLRWQVSGHLPVMGLYETQHFLALWTAIAVVYFQIRYRIERFLPAICSFLVAVLFFAGVGPATIIPLTPAINTPLFLIHVATSFAAYGLFAVGALIGIYHLFGVRVGLTSSAFGRQVMDESLSLGFILFTGCMIAGSYWAYLSWGSYWTWKIKGLWSYILWFYYAGLIHVRNKVWWKGRPVDILAIIGFGLVLFAYLGLGLFFKTSHPLM